MKSYYKCVKPCVTPVPTSHLSWLSFVYPVYKNHDRCDDDTGDKKKENRKKNKIGRKEDKSHPKCVKPCETPGPGAYISFFFVVPYTTKKRDISAILGEQKK